MKQINNILKKLKTDCRDDLIIKRGLFLFFKSIFINSTENDTNMYAARVSICYNTRSLIVLNT